MENIWEYERQSFVCSNICTQINVENEKRWAPSWMLQSCLNIEKICHGALLTKRKAKKRGCEYEYTNYQVFSDHRRYAVIRC